MATIFQNKLKTANINIMMWELGMYIYILSFMQIQQTVSDLEGFIKRNELTINKINQDEKQINKQVPMW